MGYRGSPLLTFICQEPHTQIAGAGGGTRTRTSLRKTDFKSVASTIPPRPHWIVFYRDCRPTCQPSLGLPSRLEQSLVGKGTSRMGFEIGLERKGGCFAGKRKIASDRPRHEFGCMRRFPGVMVTQTLTQILSDARIGFIRKRNTAKDVDVIHMAPVRRRCAMPDSLRPSVSILAAPGVAQRAKTGAAKRTRTSTMLLATTSR